MLLLYRRLLRRQTPISTESRDPWGRQVASTKRVVGRSMYYSSIPMHISCSSHVKHVSFPSPSAKCSALMHNLLCEGFPIRLLLCLVPLLHLKPLHIRLRLCNQPRLNLSQSSLRFLHGRLNSLVLVFRPGAVRSAFFKLCKAVQCVLHEIEVSEIAEFGNEEVDESSSVVGGFSFVVSG